MACPVFPHIFNDMIDEDLEWLEKNTSQEDKDIAYGAYQHTRDCLNYCKQMYDEYGYMQQMETNDA